MACSKIHAVVAKVTVHVEVRQSLITIATKVMLIQVLESQKEGCLPFLWLHGLLIISPLYIAS